MHAARPSGVPLVVDGTACSILGLLHTTWVSSVRRFDRRPCRQARRVGNRSVREIHETRKNQFLRSATAQAANAGMNTSPSIEAACDGSAAPEASDHIEE
jgi:hypothetical protein